VLLELLDLEETVELVLTGEQVEIHLLAL
jgi:hypothetical protein